MARVTVPLSPLLQTVTISPSLSSVGRNRGYNVAMMCMSLFFKELPLCLELLSSTPHLVMGLSTLYPAARVFPFLESAVFSFFEGEFFDFPLQCERNLRLFGLFVSSKEW